MLSDNDLAWIAAELACEVNRINAEQRMSIQAFRQALAHLPGGAQMTMHYRLGGRTQVFVIGDCELEMGPDVTASDIEAEYNKKKDKLMTTPLPQLRQSQI